MTQHETMRSDITRGKDGILMRFEDERSLWETDFQRNGISRERKELFVSTRGRLENLRSPNLSLKEISWKRDITFGKYIKKSIRSKPIEARTMIDGRWPTEFPLFCRSKGTLSSGPYHPAIRLGYKLIISFHFGTGFWKWRLWGAVQGTGKFTSGQSLSEKFPPFALRSVDRSIATAHMSAYSIISAQWLIAIFNYKRANNNNNKCACATITIRAADYQLY